MLPPQALFLFDIVKRLLIHATKFPLIFLNPNKALKSFNDITSKIIPSVLLKDENLTPIARELKHILTDLTGSQQLAQCLAHIIEYDTAYRYRIHDIARETNKDQLANNPRKELNRLIALYQEREELYGNQNTRNKISKVGKMLSTALLIPKFKKAFTKAIRQSNFTELYPDYIDIYWICQRSDYKYLGKTKEERQDMIKHLSKPKVYENV